MLMERFIEIEFTFSTNLKTEKRNGNENENNETEKKVEKKNMAFSFFEKEMSKKIKDEKRQAKLILTLIDK